MEIVGKLPEMNNAPGKAPGAFLIMGSSLFGETVAGVGVEPTTLRI